MSISYRILASRQLVLVKNHGALSREDVFYYITQLTKDPEFNSGMDEIVSLTEVTEYNLSFQDICELTSHELANQSSLQHLTRTAFVSPDSHILGKLTIYKQMSGLNQEGVGIFQKLGEACDWLGRNCTEIYAEFEKPNENWVTIDAPAVAP